MIALKELKTCRHGLHPNVEALRGRKQCQHVLSSDIKSYNKKLLGTCPALLQEVALPANFMLRDVRHVSSLAPGFEAGVRPSATRRPRNF
jgi:hypothetical protein